ncbi:hypothetical protein PPEP_a3932 [Pseudoalteromonas peptidolytica F12-50-A1]|uniref:Uncharacterized protein n=1 Tax=Pseudoalteromonas peptidolytica F12-50-A1 TaxID=1315280 RepID=A0A8I0MXF8_9GAMM|nr:hypothetical protein [Pseudoalteromonas peptidolytica F12-50-A1]GEK10093.1 hypothetical protein PPE03_23420 [Pseudoalteromonas peptidolytica]
MNALFFEGVKSLIKLTYDKCHYFQWSDEGIDKIDESGQKSEFFMDVESRKKV